MKSLLLALPFLLLGCSSSQNDGVAGSGSRPGTGGSTGGSGAAAGSGGASADGGSSSGGSGGVSPPTCESPDPATGFHAALHGTPDGDGTHSAPWDLATALNAPSGVGPGDTIWIHEGRYTGTFVIKQDGEEGAPVTIRAWPGDRVTLDGDGVTDEPVIQLYHRWMVLQDLEITNSDEDRRSSRATGIYVGADHVQLINLAVHDVGVGISGGQMTGSGVQEGTDIELYGSVFYNNGWLGSDRGHGHHTYLTNRDGIVRMEDNILSYAYGFGVHNYSYSDTHYARNYELVGNVWFLNGVPGNKLVDNCMIGHDGTHVVSGILLRENYGWAMALDDRSVRLGWDTPNEDATLVDNYLVGLTIFQDAWSGVSMTGNTFIGPVQGVEPSDHPDNTYVTTAPTQNHVVVRPNRYEAGRAHIIAYNWEETDEIAVDPSDVVPVGTAFTIHDAQDYFGSPVASGTYQGGTIQLPMTNLAPVMPIGDPQAIGPDDRTGHRFNVFVLRAAVCD